MSYLELSTGIKISAKTIGANIISSGELIFTTGMVGYEQAMTDPSYFGQILVFTFPLIGNYGIERASSDLLKDQNHEGQRIYPSGIIIGKESYDFSYWKEGNSLVNWLKSQNVPCLTSIDTRMLVHEIRQNDTIYGRVVPRPNSVFTDQLPGFEQTHDNYFYTEKEFLTPYVSTNEINSYGDGKGDFTIAVLDCGVKWNIIRSFLSRNCKVLRVPWNFDIKKIRCDAWILSNGPGDPNLATEVVEQVKKIMAEDKPIFGICLGHQLLALACGAKIYKLPYGHRGHNLPVKDVSTGQGYITSQNHGYEVNRESLPDDWEAWYVNANDNSLEGMRHKTRPILSVQFHPEAAGGPTDTAWLFDSFLELAKKHRENNG